MNCDLQKKTETLIYDGGRRWVGNEEKDDHSQSHHEFENGGFWRKMAVRVRVLAGTGFYFDGF